MALRFYQMNETFGMWLDISNYIFTLIYNLEAALKIFACGHNYFLNNWNKFDFFIVIVGDLSIFADIFDHGNSDLSKILRIIKALRIMRIFRLVRVSRKLRILVDSLIVIFPSIANIGSLIMLLLFIFSVIGMSMFSQVIHQTQINENMNFSNFSMSIIILIRCATGENWNLIMRELSIDPSKKIQRFRPDGSIYIEQCLLSQTW
jgi:voltage-gated sodium channel type IV alpha